MKKYILICSDTPENLVAMINEKMEDGYMPAGSVWEGTRGFCQGMILQESTGTLYMGHQMGPGNMLSPPVTTTAQPKPPKNYHVREAHELHDGDVPF